MGVGLETGLPREKRGLGPRGEQTWECLANYKETQLFPMTTGTRSLGRPSERPVKDKRSA